MNSKMGDLCKIILLISVISFSCNKSDEASNNQTTTLDVRTAIAIKDVSYGNDSLQKLDVYLPANRSIDSTKVLYLIHGGAWVAGDKKDFDSNVVALKSVLPQYAFVNINYRLSSLTGTNEWPTQINDVNTAIDFVMNKSSYYQINNAKSAVMGASAGGQLALLKGFKYNGTGNIHAVVDLFGPTDMLDFYNNPSNPNYPLLLQIFMNGTPTTNYNNYISGSPLYFVNNTNPPTIIFHGTTDSTVPIHQSDSLNIRLIHAGVPTQYVVYQGEGHGWTGSNLTDTYNKLVSFLIANNK